MNPPTLAWVPSSPAGCPSRWTGSETPLRGGLTPGDGRPSYSRWWDDSGDPGRAGRREYCFPMEESGQEPANQAAVRWPVFLPVCAVGLILTGLSILTSVAWNWQGIWPSVFLEFGATILLSALLYVGQRSFIQVVREEARTAAQNVGARAQVFESRLGEQAARIDTLAQEVESVHASRHAEEDAALAAITEDMTYGAVSDLLSYAERGRVIAEFFRVQASAELTRMHLRFKNVYLVNVARGGLPLLSLTPWFLDGRMLQSIYWDDSKDVSRVMEEIITTLERSNIDASTTTFDPKLAVTNLRNSLTVAFRSRRGQLPRRLRASLIELADNQWAFTEAGLESLTDDTFVSKDVFSAMTSGLRDSERCQPVTPAAPAGVPEHKWQTLMKIAARTYRLEAGGLAGRRPVVS